MIRRAVNKRALLCRPARIDFATLIPGVVTVALSLAIALGPGARIGNAFSIGIGDTFSPFQYIFQASKETRHESITIDAVEGATPSVTSGWTPSLAFETDLVRGVQNTDITHQFDCDSHFDNSTVKPVPAAGQSILCSDGQGHKGFDAGFATLRHRYQVALDYAKGNPQFLNPSFVRFSDVVVDIQGTLDSLQGDQACSDALACPQARLAPVKLELLAYMAALGYNPNPDPHTPDGETSPFFPTISPLCGACGLLYPVNAIYTSIVQGTLDKVDELLGPHAEPPIIGCGCNKTLAEALGTENPLVKELEKERDEVRAYLAFQNLGHVFHTTEDFFAHTNYVELMASGLGHTTVVPGDSIASITGLQPSQIPVPTNYNDFSLGGIQSLMGASGADSSNLQSGAVVTIWLGEGDYCASTHSFFNPTISSTQVLPSFSVGSLFTFPGFSIGGGGAGAAPPPGFDFCHYQTATAMGLNKDEPISESHEAQAVNFDYARSAAERMAEALWQDFLGKLTPTTAVTSSPAPVDGLFTTQQTTLTLKATDSSGKGIASITYEAAGANTIASATVAGDTATLTISNPGDTEVHFYATDNAGVQEQVKTYVARLRSTPANSHYDYRTIAATSGAGTSGFTQLGVGPSINDWGEVAFEGGTSNGGTGLYLADATGAVRAVNPGWSTNPTRRFDDFVNVNNGDAIAANDRISGSPPSWRIRLWDGRPGVVDTWHTLDASSSGTTSQSDVTFDPGFPGVPAAGIAGMMTARPAGFDVTITPGSPGNGFDSVILPTMNDNGDVAWLGLTGGTWQFTNSTGATSPDSYSGSLRQVITDDGHIIARAGGDSFAPGAPPGTGSGPLMMWDTSFGSEQTIACASGCAHPGFTNIGRFAGASDDTAVIAFTATGPLGTGIYASVRATIGPTPTTDGRVIVPVAMTGGAISKIEGAYQVAVNSTEKSAERAVEIAFMADDSTGGNKGIWVSRLHFVGNADGTLDLEHPTKLTADAPQMIVELGSTVPGLAGTVTDVWYWDPINNRNNGDLVFWLAMTGNRQAIVRARPQCANTDYAAGTEVDSQYINQYDAGGTHRLPKAYNQRGGSACGPSSLSMLINNIQHARGVARAGKMADLDALYGDGTTDANGHPNGVMRLANGQNTAITDNADAIYDRSRAEAILASAHWTFQETIGKAGLDAALDAGMQVIQSTSFGTGGQAYNNNGGMGGSFGGGHMVLFVGRTPMGDYIVEDPAGDYFADPTHSSHYGPGKCGSYSVYAQSTVEFNLNYHSGGSTSPRYGLALGYKQQSVDPDVLLVQAFPTGTADRGFNMWVTDSSGRKAGFPAGDSSAVSVIPGSSASIDPIAVSAPDSSTDEEILPSRLPYAILIVNPSANLQVHVSGAASTASYQLEFTHFDGGTQTSSDQVFGSIAPGQSTTMRITHTPVATAQDVKVVRDTPRAITLAATDQDGDPLTYAIGTQPAHGTLSPVDATGNITYTPAAGFLGADSFTFTATDGVTVSKAATVTITVKTNEPPTVTIPPPGTATEGAGLNITASASDPDQEQLTYSWSATGGQVTPSGDGSHAVFTSNEGPSDGSVSVIVTDPHGASATASAAIHVENAAPTGSFSAGGAVEGSPFTLSLTNVTDPSPTDTAAGFTYAFDCGGGYGPFASFASASCSTVDNGVVAVGVQVRDRDAGVREYRASVTVSNVPPTVSAGGARTQFWGQPVSFGGAAADPSSADQAAGFASSWNFGDGQSSTAASTVHAYAKPGSYSARFSATDKDGGTGSTTVAVTIAKRGGALASTGATSAPYGFLVLQARLTDSVDAGSALLAGHSVVFVLGSQSYVATTDGSGVATVTPSPVAPGSYPLAVSLANDVYYNASAARATVTVTRSLGRLAGSGLTLAGGGSASLSVTSTSVGVTGTLSYSSPSLSLSATSLSPLGIRADGHAAWLTGVDSAGRKLVVYAEDNGPAGAGDVVKLWVNGTLVSGALTGGDVAISSG